MNTNKIIKQAQEKVKLVISGYLMDISEGKIDSNGNWVFKGENEFDRDLDKVLTQAITQAVEEAKKNTLQCVSTCKTCEEARRFRGNR